MSLPPIHPVKTTSGIAVDPRTQERVVPGSRRADGSLRRELKIRPGFTPQEDMTRFRGSKQQQQDRNALPKGHILGWVAPSSATAPKTAADSGALSKSAKKNEKRREKKREEKARAIKDSWEDEDEDESPAKPESPKAMAAPDVDQLADKLADAKVDG